MGLRLDAEEARTSGAVEEEPIIVDLYRSIFEVLRRVETTPDPSVWICAALQENAARDGRAGHDVRARLTELLAEMVRIVDLEQELQPEARGWLDALLACAMSRCSSTSSAWSSTTGEGASGG